MSIRYLEAIAILALVLVVLPWLMRAFVWLCEVHDARLRRRHAARRRQRRRGYLPVHDEQWDPQHDLLHVPREP